MLLRSGRAVGREGKQNAWVECSTHWQQTADTVPPSFATPLGAWLVYVDEQAIAVTAVALIDFGRKPFCPWPSLAHVVVAVKSLLPLLLAQVSSKTSTLKVHVPVPPLQLQLAHVMPVSSVAVPTCVGPAPTPSTVFG